MPSTDRPWPEGGDPGAEEERAAPAASSGDAARTPFKTRVQREAPRCRTRSTTPLGGGRTLSLSRLLDDSGRAGVWPDSV